ncbi:hypothetical protein [Clostridium lacusfryxellense]|uniref:hypothetical protein n=1 Tax=Clostridium lacusfryxellense TaxID=205328 RepID=UPI001C0BF895|nr:hypothetical protein [Clostridium lacusfryxellense]MBU3110935.1 hypothetical protein [Clostridium lacusfryxellense]
MRKPSIFSKNYDKEVKRRKIIIITLIILPVIGLGIFFSTGFDAVLNKGISMKNGINSILSNKSKDNKKDEQNKAAAVKKESEKVIEKQAKTEKDDSAKAESASKAVSDIKDQHFDVTFSDGQKVSIEYSQLAEVKTIKGVTNDKEVSYDISPSKKAIVLQSIKNQDMLYVDVNEIKTDITKKAYVSSKNVTFTKKEQLNKNPSYLWSVSPKFIDEDNIAYVSELPWLKKTVKYIWKVNLKNNTHKQVQRVSGKEITFDKITPEGLAANIDGNIVYITPMGKVVK